MTFSPKPPLVLRILPILMRLVFGSACIALAVWGKRFCREAIDSAAPPGAYPDFNRLAAELSWALFFGPFALLGLYALVRACVTSYRVLLERRRADGIEILPPLSGAAIETGDAAAATSRTDSPLKEPLDDSTRRRLDQFVARAVRVSGIVVGMLFVGLGLAGFLWAWTQEHRPFPNSGLVSVAFALRFLIVCGVFVLLGAYILRETFARPKTGWLAPLGVFTAIASRKLAEEEQRKDVQP